MKTASLILERFDGPLVSVAERPPSLSKNADRDAYHAGHADGYAAGLGEARTRTENEVQNLSNALRAAIESFSASQQTLQQDAARQAVEATAVIVSAVLPELARRGLAAEVSAILKETVKTPAIRVLTVAARAGEIDELRAAMADTPLEAPVRFIIDEHIGETAAQISWEGGGVDIDLDGAMSACLKALNDSLNEKERVKS